ncbi:uncharacterized protein LOC116978385 [Amblyraja radiata]|uniref:uncharacterized protein LOC116978385 n=1 Tax=Amblyraja radiata TaxID=386614 RepID=UPI00140246CE|nr:uncharacterized protein LOC116978385 [Amblyraja radiata]
MQWFTNQRTIYGKVTALGTKTGSAGSTLTESSTPSPSTSQQHRSRHISSIDLTTPGGAEEGTDGNSIKSLNNTVRDGIKLLEEGHLRPNSFTQRAVDFCQAIMEEEINEGQWDFVWNMINGAITMRNKKLMEARAPEAQRPLVPQPRPPHFYDQYTDRTYGLPRAMGAHPPFRAEQRHSPSPLMFTEQQPARNPPLPFVYGEGRAQTPFQEGADGFADVNDSS